MEARPSLLAKHVWPNQKSSSFCKIVLYFYFFKWPSFTTQSKCRHVRLISCSVCSGRSLVIRARFQSRNATNAKRVFIRALYRFMEDNEDGGIAHQVQSFHPYFFRTGPPILVSIDAPGPLLSSLCSEPRPELARWAHFGSKSRPTFCFLSGLCTRVGGAAAVVDRADRAEQQSQLILLL